jgi:hypothetical protein
MPKLALFLIIVFAASFAVNVWQAYTIQALNLHLQEVSSGLNDLTLIQEQFSEPNVHLIDYEWNVRTLDWEHQRVEVNFTLFNSGIAPANFTLSIDVFDTSKESPDSHVTSSEWDLGLNGTTVETFTKIFYLTKPTESWHIDCIEFHSIYFFENSLGYETPIH